MDFSQFGILFLFGTIGAFIGMRLSRYFKRSRTQKNENAKDVD